MGSIITDVCVKLYYDWLRIYKALGNFRKQDKQQQQQQQQQQRS